MTTTATDVDLNIIITTLRKVDTPPLCTVMTDSQAEMLALSEDSVMRKSPNMARKILAQWSRVLPLVVSPRCLNTILIANADGLCKVLLATR